MERKTSRPPLAGITLKQLRALTAVAETGSNVAAASRLNVTPPAVALQLKIIEEEAGLPLLERGPDGLCPTTAGEELLATAAKIESALSECGEALRALKQGEGGRVSVGVVSTAKYFAPRAFAAFARLHPNVEIDLYVGNRADIVRELERFHRDIVIMGRPPEKLDLVTKVVGAHPHIVIAPIDHPLVGKRGLKLAALAGEKWLVREHGSGTRLLMERLFDEARATPRIAMEIGSNETIKQAVMAGMGIAFLSAHTVSLELKARQLATLDVRGLPAMRSWFAVRRADKRLLPATALLWDYLTTRGKDFLPRVA
ncbi:MAG: LysR family transcriptional regulator [Hyphomicrobiaceae bacterium]|nr:LysR family transcriptional regulator [Hyphomicrobiaceae bacterium]